MDNKRIGIFKDLAIIVEKENDIFNVKQLALGHYVFDNNIFVDDEGNTYKHLINFSEGNVKHKYFIGNIPLTRTYLNKRNTHIEDSYLNEYKRYSFTIDDEDIICTDKYTNEKYIYQDQNTMIRSAIDETLEEISSNFSQEEPEQENEEQEFEFNQNIQDIKTNLKKYLKGQDNTVNLIADRIFEKYSFESKMESNMLLIVPGEDEKKQIINAIKNSVEIPLYELNLPDIRDIDDDSYDTDSLIIRLLNTAKEDPNIVKNSIIIVDGLEKISINGRTSEYIPYLKKFQKSLSNLLEGNIVNITVNGESASYDTSNNLFICLFDLKKHKKQKETKLTIGFSDEHYKKNDSNKIENNQYGLTSELLNKIPNIISINKNTEDEIYDIILNDESGIVSKTRKILYDEYGIEIKNLENVVKMITKEIIENKSSTKDAIHTIQKMLEKIKHEIYENPGKYNEVILGKNILNDNNDFVLRKINKKIKIKAM